MVKKVGRATQAHGAGAPSARAGKAQAATLKELKAKTVNFMDRKGAELLGAGKLHEISDRPPQRSAKRVSTAAGPSLFSGGIRKKGR